LALAGAGAAIPGGLAAQSAKKAGGRRGRIDVHQHMKSPADPNSGLARTWTPEKAIADMDRNGIATAIVSPVNGVREAMWTGTEKARGAVRENNEYGAKLVRDYPGRFGL
jgi:predicted TIM-barrel fold metal-dependent hydrolase